MGNELSSNSEREDAVGLREEAYQRRCRQRHKAELNTVNKAYHQAQQRRVPQEELTRLRLPENRAEALNYGSGKETVCLGCGYYGDNLGRHVGPCPEDPRNADSYKEHWEHNRTTSLASLAWQERASRNNKENPQYLEARRKNSSKTIELFATERGRRSIAKQAGESIRRGRRLEAVKTRERKKSPRKSAEQDYRLAKTIHDLLLKYREGTRIKRTSQAIWPTQRARWESALRQHGFTAQVDIDALISSRNATPTAAKSIAHKKGITPRTVQNAYSMYKSSFYGELNT